MRKEKGQKTYREAIIIRIIVWTFVLFLLDYGIYYWVKCLNTKYTFGERFFNALDVSNALEIYVTILSLVFIVTSLVSVLSDKSEMIYWVSVMEYKLVNPVFFNLTNLSAALIANIFHATVFMMIKPKLVFLCLAWVIVILIIITSLMMSGFFYREPVRRKLEHEFMVNNLYFKVYRDFAKAKEHYLNDTKENGDAILYNIYLLEEGENFSDRLISFYLDIEDEEKDKNNLEDKRNNTGKNNLRDKLKTDRNIKKLIRKLEKIGVYDQKEKKIKNDYDKYIQLENFPSLSSEVFDQKIADIKNGKELQVTNEYDEETLVEYYEWEEKNKIRESEKKQFVKQLDTLIKFCYKRYEKFQVQKNELVGYSLNCSEENKITQLVENVELLKIAGRCGNVREIMSRLSQTNPEVYTHVLEMVYKDICFQDLDSITNTMLLNCITKKEYPFTVEYYFERYRMDVVNALVEFDKDVFLYQHDPVGRNFLVERLQVHNEALYNSIKFVNELLFMIFRSKNIPLVLSICHVLKKHAIYKEFFLLGYMWSCFSGYTADAKEYNLGYVPQIMNLSWFLPEYLPLFERTLNGALKEGLLSPLEIEQILEDFTEDSRSKDGTEIMVERMKFDKSSNTFQCNLELDNE